MTDIDHEFTVDTARSAAAHDGLSDWVRRFLESAGSDNAVLAEQLATEQRWWTGPVRLPVGRLHRLAGPADHPVLRSVDDDYWRDDVDDLAERIDDDDAEPPPVVVMVRDGQLVLEDGNHRVEALRRAGHDHAWGVVGFESEAESHEFEVPDALTTD